MKFVADRASEKALYAFLVAAHRSGDRNALGKLVTASSPRLFAHAVRLLNDRDGAQDVVQESWGDIIRGLGNLRDEAAFLPWAFRIVSRRVSDVIARRQKDRAIAQDFPHEAEHRSFSDGPANADAAVVRQAIAQLDGPHRATLALFYLEDMSVAEVALALNIPIGTVKTRLMHAREKMRVILEGEHP
ncbi:RNA polymerase sigma factor [Rhizobium sp. L1K21]|nr:RNA polymerase sigma factor [Rhizobium sp. L1K21]